MATVTKPIALDESFNTTEVTPRNIADVLAEGLSHITGRTASEVEYDNTDSGLTADNVQDAIDEVNGKVPTLPSVDIQTAVDEFETYNGGLLSSCKVALSPNQDLHGYENPWVGGAGKNKLPLTLANIKSANTVGTWSDNVYTIYGMTYTVNTDDSGNVTYIEANGTPLDSNAQLSLNKTAFLSGSFIGNGCPSGGGSEKYRIRFAGGLNGNDYGHQSEVMTADPNVAINVYIRVDVGITADHLKFYPMLRLSTESDPTFEPYSNICPISGHTQVEMEVGTNKLNPDNIVQGSLTTSAVSTRCSTRGNLTIPISAGQTITVSRQSSTINFALAVTDSSMSVLFDSGWQTGSYTYVSAYDGYVELVFAKQDGTDITPSNVKSANFMVEFGSTPSTYVPYTKGTYSLTVNLGGTYYSGTLDVVSGVLTADSAFIASYNGETLPSTWISDRDVYAVGTTPTTGAEVVYKLATPQSIQLSPTMVKALVGENHLSAPLEGQEITESKYKQMFTFDDVIAYIQSLS